MKKSGSGAPEEVETRVAAYLDSIKKGLGYQMVYAVCDQSRAYYTYEGLCKYIDIENDPDDFYYESGSDSSRMTKYMEDLGWYLVVEDLSPDKINVLEITIISIIIFVIGLLMIAMVFFVIFMRERKAAIELIERRTISLTDAMTGLLNRRALEEDCADIQDQGLVAQTTILMMDVNSLKEANDTYGHSAGDELIILAADCMQTAFGKLGKVYRTGGDEFVALLACSEVERKDALRTLDHLIGSTTCSFDCVLSVSKGVVVCREHGELTFDEMRDLADQRMYEDKLTYYKRTGKEHR